MRNLLKDCITHSRLLLAFAQWFDSELGLEENRPSQQAELNWLRVLPFLLAHIMCLAVFWVGWSRTAVGTALGLYFVRMFAITGFYHRYFSHKTFKTNRFWQVVFAVLGNTAVQHGPLWWAAHHRHHHRYADQVNDVHSPSRRGFFYSHIGWLADPGNFAVRREYIRDWMKFPELYWLDRFNTTIPLLLAIALFGSGALLARYAPHLNTNGAQMVIWGFFVSTIVLFHATSTINSLDHMFGSRRYNTPDTSRNNAVLALLTLGEGWHNNHHHYPVSARQGFFWWELDFTYYGLVLLSWLRIIRELHPLPDRMKYADQAGL